MKIELVREFNIKFKPENHPRGHTNDLHFYLYGQCSVPQIPSAGMKIISPYIGEENDFRHEYAVSTTVKEVRFFWLKRGVLFPSVILESCTTDDHSELLVRVESFFNACIKGTTKWMFETDYEFLVKFGTINNYHNFEISEIFFQSLLMIMKSWNNKSK